MSVSQSSRFTAPATRPACADFPALFQDQLLEEPPTGSRAAADRRRYDELRASANRVCASCPLAARCLYAAVVDHDVAGIAAGTTARERQAVRRRLDLLVEPEDFDTMAGVTACHRQVDHAEVLRVRRAYPDEGLETLARRLGCSLSTVKRHLRRARTESAPLAPVRTARPTLAQVLQALLFVRGGVTQPVRRTSVAA